jgi:tetratricopeptide (TPR) repeat protein
LNLASLYEKQGEYASAEPLLVQALEGYRQKLGADHPQTLTAQHKLAELYRATGEEARAEPLHTGILEARRRTLGKDDPEVAVALAQLGLNLLRQQKYAEAEPLLRECLKIRTEKLPDDWATFDTRSRLGESLLGQKMYAEAEPLLLAGYEGMKQRADKIPVAGAVRLTEALERLVQLYDAWGKVDQANEWRKKLSHETRPSRE